MFNDVDDHYVACMFALKSTYRKDKGTCEKREFGSVFFIRIQIRLLRIETEFLDIQAHF